MNITNIDDKVSSGSRIFISLTKKCFILKIIRKSNETGRSWKLIADEYEAEFWEDLNKLNIVQPDIKLRVTDKIPEIIAFIEGIETKGFTRVAGDGSVHFKTSTYQNYGKLQNVVVEEGSAAAEFALWKAAKPGEPFWDSKWGKGRPGWHIECSTLASLIFGSKIDFHAGGLDLKFPHHENEEAQSCVHHSVEDWVTHWIHTGHLHLKGQSEKMSKSLKNTVTIRELLQHHSSDQFRVACLLSHYRSSIEFGPELLTAAERVLNRVQSFRDDCQAYIQGLKECGAVNEQDLMSVFEACQKEVDTALCDDFNTSRSIGAIIELMSNVNKIINNVPSELRTTTGCEKTIVQAVVNFVNKTFATFGVGEQKVQSSKETEMESLVNAVVKVRNDIRLKAKAEKNKELFKVCDSMRETFIENGIQIKDHGSLSSWNKI